MTGFCKATLRQMYPGNDIYSWDFAYDIYIYKDFERLDIFLHIYIDVIFLFRLSDAKADQ